MAMADSPSHSTLVSLAQQARAAWPDLFVADEVLFPYLLARLPSPYLADLYLACACAHRSAGALETFDRALLVSLSPALAQIEIEGCSTDDVIQHLRERLFVTQADARPKILDYSGRGPLAGWLRAVAVRSALNLRRHHQGPSQSSDDERLLFSSSGADPELEHLKDRFRSEFSAAFRIALQSLSSEERNVLRLHFLNDVSLERIGQLYRAHKSTISRWVTRARQTLLLETRRALGQQLRLELEGAELDSLMRRVESNLEVNVRAAFNTL